MKGGPSTLQNNVVLTPSDLKVLTMVRLTTTRIPKRVLTPSDLKVLTIEDFDLNAYVELGLNTLRSKGPYDMT